MSAYALIGQMWAKQALDRARFHRHTRDIAQRLARRRQKVDSFNPSFEREATRCILRQLRRRQCRV